MTEDHLPVAIVGMSCFFPDSSGLKPYWRLLFHGRDAIKEVPPTHWSKQDYFDPDPRTPDRVYCTRGGFIPPIEFDPSEFGIPPSSLEATDTSQLLALSAARQALSDAGLPCDPQRTSVILGVTGTQELVIPLSSRLGFPIWRQALEEAGVEAERCERIIQRIADSYVSWQENSFPGLLGNVVAGRISNRLDLRGTNCVVDAACASSFAAVHLALLELTSGRSDTVITGGIDTLNDIFMHMCFAKTQILSPTGDARPFSKDADGTVLGEGVGILVLKRLADAERDGNRVYAVIKGIGSSSDGRSQSIYAPCIEGQVKALAAAYAAAGIDPATVDLLEAHGTGTRVGDKVEFQALCEVMGQPAPGRNRCALGSIKSMIGHTKAAAGAAGLIKAALAVYHKVLPPTLKAEDPDPALNIASSRFYLNTRKRPWSASNGQPRRAGVSAFGFGGSNFHIVLEEHHPQKPRIAWTGSIDILAFSAPTRAELSQTLTEFMREADTPPTDPAFALAAARTRTGFSSRHAYRLLLAVEDPAGVSDTLTQTLRALEPPGAENPLKVPGVFFGGPEDRGSLAFLFPGQGSQYVGMGCDVICTFPRSMAVLENAECRLALGHPLGDLIFPPDRQTPRRHEDILRATDVAQPAIGTVSLAMLRALDEFGLRPDAVGGHSFGELTALCAAGRVTEADFFDLAAARGKAMAQAEAGAMLAVRGPSAVLEKLIARANLPVVVANRNSPEQVVLSGAREPIAEAARLCRGNGYAATALPVSGAFHSPLMRSAQEAFAQALSGVDIAPADVPVYCNHTAAPYPEQAEGARRLLAEHLVRPIDFMAEIEAMYAAGIRIFLEVGPKSVLTGLVASILKGRSFHAVALDRSTDGTSGLVHLARTLCCLAALGRPLRLENWDPPHLPAAPPRMRVAITGANCRPERRQPNNPSASFRAPGYPPPSVPAQLKLASGKTETPHSADILRTNNEIMAKIDSPTSDARTDALRSIQEGLKTIQAIQIQTAQVHQKFLETQSEASRILLELVKNTGRLAGVNLEAVPATPAAARSAAIPPVSLSPDPSASAPTLAAPPARQTGLEKGEARSTDPGTAAPSVPRVPQASLMLQSALLDVVSELTGYPADMLGLDMDIESDLGIDSIKRVEILSALEEKMPGLPAVTPEDMGRLKTLAQIIAFLNGTRPGAQPADPSGALADGMPTNHAHRQSLQSTLLGIVSELTGYPPDMLGLDLDIESDLGIDSIKRVEILSALEEKMPGLPAVAPEDMGRLKTLAQILSHLSGAQAAPVAVVPSAGAPAAIRGIPPAALSEPVRAPGEDRPAPRQVVTVMDAPSPEETAISLPRDRKIFVTDDRSGLSQAIASVLSEKGINTILVSVDILKFKKDLPRAAGLVIVQDPESTSPEADLRQAFELTRALGPDLGQAGKDAGAFFATVTHLDGAFGFVGAPLHNPIQGGLAGLAKTAALEWPDVRCRALDIDPSWRDQRAIANAVCRELAGSGPVEIGLSANSRRTLALAPAPYPTGAVDLKPAELIVISGGARGIAAACALELARRFRPTLVLLGRSPEPAPEPEWLGGIEEEAAVKRVLLEQEFAGTSVKPADLEARFRQLMANREIARTLDGIQAAGASARYYAADTRDAERVAGILQHARRQYGPVRALIHAAGVLEDRLIVEKSAEQFERVFSTKVAGFKALLEAASKDDLKYIVLFSSVTARIGNKGQADYAMANEALNKLAVMESQRRPDCRVISINWGPWDGGMVTPPLKREFERQGVSLLPVAAGVGSLLKEMERRSGEPVEVVIGGMLNPTRAQATPEKSPRDLSILFEREIDLDSYPVLRSHMINGQAVVPLALMAEWFGHGALHENPGLMLHGLEDLRVLSGIRLKEESKLIRLLAGKARRKDKHFEVDLELRNGVREGRDILHSRARAILTEDYGRPPVYHLPASLISNHYPRSAAEIYEKILFHGSHLHGLRGIQCCTPDGMVADAAGAPAPSYWMASPLRHTWLWDPLVLDSAFQMASLWCYDQRGCVSLPSHASSYRQFRSGFPADGARVVLEVREATDRKMRGDFTFLDRQGQVIARLIGYESVMDPLLNRAFKA